LEVTAVFALRKLTFAAGHRLAAAAALLDVVRRPKLKPISSREHRSTKLYG
jgi:hypothetical protein